MIKWCFLIVTFLLSSCVGTVQDAKVKLDKLFDENKTVLDFQGLEVARPISHDKVELEFTPVGDSDPNLKYLLYVNNSLSPIEINPDSLDKAAGGRARYLVDNLYINTKYKFKLKLKNILTEQMSASEKELTVKTFDNTTADFKGITSVSKINGQSDSSIRVDWVTAKMKGAILVGPYDPVYYEVTIIGAGGPEKLNDNTYTLSDKKKIRVPDYPMNLSPFNYTDWTSVVIGSLLPNTEYFIQVRAVHTSYDRFLQDPDVTFIPINKEVNTKFLSIRTDALNGAFDFNDLSFKAQPGSGYESKTRINTSWNSATGTFVGYRLFYRKCVEVDCTDRDAVLNKNLLSDERMAEILLGTLPDAGFVPVNVLKSTSLNYALKDLDPYSWYELKLVACRNVTCVKESGDAIQSLSQVVKTAPTLASFTGINALEHPDTAATMDHVILKFDVPDLVNGYADRLEFFCIDPLSVTPEQDQLQYAKLQPNQMVGNTVTPSVCRGITLCGPKAEDCDNSVFNFSVGSSTSVRIKGIKTDGTRYCFAGFPAIRDEVTQLPVTNPTQEWIIRCITPEVKTPVIAEFPGITNNCGFNQNTLTVTWDKPTAGIYNGYRVFWKKVEGSTIADGLFRFSDAVNGINQLGGSATEPYFSSPDLGPTTLTYTIQNLRPGTRYKIGVLAEAADANQVKWSEYNTRIKDCVTSMPRYKFEEWTRIFAIGPKVDGRFPLVAENRGGTTVRAVSEDAYIYEALNNDGIPYELTIDPVTGVVDPAGVYYSPPGHYSGTYLPNNFVNIFDGAFGLLGTTNGTPIAASKRGIISLAWKQVTLDFLHDEFKDCQLNPNETSGNSNCTVPSEKNNRRYGYKVYRSTDNRLSWQDVTKLSTDAETIAGTSLIYAKDYSYYKRADQEPTVDKMAFFTDYSVQSMRNDATLKSQARIYWYKIVPYFDNKQIALDPTQSNLANAPNEIKVILPPDNMALMHRWMANRQACNEIDRGASLDKLAHYTCAFNGFGSRPKGFPWSSTNTVVDLGGHLLIDRFELGCNFTRGDASANPTTSGASEYDRKQTFPANSLLSDLPDFKGKATDAGGNDTSKLFHGCAQRKSEDYSPTLPIIPKDQSIINFKSDYRKFVQGDCVGYGSMYMAQNVCTNNPNLYVWYQYYSFPGATRNIDANGDLIPYRCYESTPERPTYSTAMLDPEFSKNIVTQSEFAAVMFHTHRGNAKYINPRGPNGMITDWTTTEAAYGKTLACYINLAAIGPASSNNNWIARWIPISDLNHIKGSANFPHSTIGQMAQNPNLYDATNFKFPNSNQINDSRISLDTKIGRVVTSNSSKLPGITNLPVDIAQNLCSTYDVEVGFSTDGMNYLTLNLPKQKRLLGRQELISASAWPDAANETAVGNFNYDIDHITSLEADTDAGYCSVAGKAYGQEVATHGDPMKTTMTRVSGFGPSMLLTGSSSNDEGDAHSQLCISKYGIQDLVGNAAEITTDRLFCDYSGDKLYFGRYDGTQGYEEFSAEMPATDNSNLVWLKTKVIKETATGDEEIIDGVTEQGKMWADISDKSGYCSIVDNVNPSIYANISSRFKDQNGNFYSVLKPDQTLNTTMVPKANPVVQTNIDKLRNGDGYFLNFGVGSPGPYLQRDNSMAVNTSGFTYAPGMALGPYFNPIIGMTMRCPDSSCGLSKDNMIASTFYFMTDANAAKPVLENVKIPYFPVGNSQLMNQGISETRYYTNNPVVSLNLAQGAGANWYVTYEIRKKLNGTIERKTKPVQEWAEMEFGSLENAGTQNFSSLSFKVARGSELILTHGADATSAKTGRYTLETLIGSRGSQTTDNFTAARCGVLIED